MDTKAKELERIWALVDRVRGRHLTLAGALRELAHSGVPLNWRTVVRIASARGWDEGVPGMKEGGKRLLVIPANMAYGEKEIAGKIPANSALVFEVDLTQLANVPGQPLPSFTAPPTGV